MVRQDCERACARTRSYSLSCRKSLNHLRVHRVHASEENSQKNASRGWDCVLSLEGEGARQGSLPERVGWRRCHKNSVIAVCAWVRLDGESDAFLHGDLEHLPPQKRRRHWPSRRATTDPPAKSTVPSPTMRWRRSTSSCPEEHERHPPKLLTIHQPHGAKTKQKRFAGKTNNLHISKHTRVGG